MEVCCTLGMIEKQQALELKQACLTTYNHYLDTSREYYPNVITTRTYDECLETIKHVRKAGINVCSGGIIGLGEAEEDRVGLLHTLATLPSHAESVPINALLAVKGTPLEDQKYTDTYNFKENTLLSFQKCNSLISKDTVNNERKNNDDSDDSNCPHHNAKGYGERLSAGRVKFSVPEQALCFLVGASSIFTGEKLLTTPNNDFDADQSMFKLRHFNTIKNGDSGGSLSRGLSTQVQGFSEYGGSVSRESVSKVQSPWGSITRGFSHQGLSHQGFSHQVSDLYQLSKLLFQPNFPSVSTTPFDQTHFPLLPDFHQLLTDSTRVKQVSSVARVLELQLSVSTQKTSSSGLKCLMVKVLAGRNVLWRS
ncbi:radical SAM superfamily protein [Artemisia annua]|uniref:Radical SAM superfamily protein n=1 Tax=Artemisia annua TaxID=35608 RepID=A0A2U1MEM9_ARTAN|nr:radical SAM superfamily protein [Artemisia annua]